MNALALPSLPMPKRAWNAIKRRLGFDVVSRSSVDEVDIAIRALNIKMSRGVMVDVGGHFGHTAIPFCAAGWRVVAFEPDSLNRQKLVESLTGYSNATIDQRALSNAESDAMTFFRSAQSTGISGLSAFHSSHVASDTVKVTTLAKATEEYSLSTIDFLKIDTEGFDKFVLEGLAWEKLSPRMIVCEFEDFKTVPLGYTFHDLARFLTDKGYMVMVSEWIPIVAYGAQHQWSRFKAYPCELDSERGWGNLIATMDPALFARVQDRCNEITRKLS